MSLMFSSPFCTLSYLTCIFSVVQLVANNIFHKCAHVVLVCSLHEKSTTFISSVRHIMSRVQKVKWGHVPWICKGSQFAWSTYTSKMICTVLGEWFVNLTYDVFLTFYRLYAFIANFVPWRAMRTCCKKTAWYVIALHVPMSMIVQHTLLSRSLSSTVHVVKRTKQTLKLHNALARHIKHIYSSTSFASKITRRNCNHVSMQNYPFFVVSENSVKTRYMFKRTRSLSNASA